MGRVRSTAKAGDQADDNPLSAKPLFEAFLQARLASQTPQAEIERRWGIKQNTVSRWEQGLIQTPDLENVKKALRFIESTGFSRHWLKDGGEALCRYLDRMDLETSLDLGGGMAAPPAAPSPQVFKDTVCERCREVVVGPRFGARLCSNCGHAIGVRCRVCGLVSPSYAKHCTECGSAAADEPKGT